MRANSLSNYSTIFFSIGFFAVSVIAITLLISSATFFLGEAVGPWQFPVALGAALGLNYLVFSKHLSSSRSFQLVLYLGVPLLMLLVSLLISGWFYDVSFDGQAYHQEALIQLEAGWNPYRQYLPDTVNQAIWVNHYAKGMEIVQSTIYATFQDIELGKSINVLLWIGSMFLVLSLLQHFKSISLKKGILLCVLLSSSPVVFNQLLTYYVDGVLSSCLLILLATLILIFLQPQPYHWILLVFVAIILANIKFTGFVYFALFIGAFSAWFIARRRQKTFYTLLAVASAAGILAVVVGYNPYITNFINYDHPLYPLMGEQKVDIMDINTPYGFNGKSDVERFFISFFAHTENLYPWNHYDINLKIPFTFNKTDLVNAPKVDARLAGFGPFFSGIFILVIALGVLLAKKVRKSRIFTGATALIAIIVLSVIIMPESWWARYVPQLWFIPFIVLIVAEILLGRQHRILIRSLYLACVLNFLFYLPNIVMVTVLTAQINHQLRVFEAAKQPVVLDWGASESNRIRFIEKNIPYREVPDLEAFILPGTNIAYFPGSEARFIKSESDHGVQKSGWLEIVERWMPNTWKHY